MYWDAPSGPSNPRGRPLLIPPRRVPYHLASLDNTNDAFRNWLHYGTVVPSSVDYAADPELSALTRDVEARRVGMIGNPLDRAMTLGEFFARPSGDTGWYDRPFDENEPRTWFVKGTPTPSIGSIITRRQAGLVSLYTAQEQEEKRESERQGKWSTTKKVVVAGAVVGVPIGTYFLGRALKWWK